MLSFCLRALSCCPPSLPVFALCPRRAAAERVTLSPGLFAGQKVINWFSLKNQAINLRLDEWMVSQRMISRSLRLCQRYKPKIQHMYAFLM